MSPLQARTIAEAFVYIEQAIGVTGEDIDWDHYSSVRRKGDVFAVRFDGPYHGRHHRLELEAPIESEESARAQVAEDELTYGEGQSLIVDAGQWMLLEGGYAGAAGFMLERLGERRANREYYQSIFGAFETAQAAATEIIKFLPPGGDTVPDSAFWTVSGREIRSARPQLFRRARIASGIDRYRREREAFVARHYPPVD